MSHCIDLRKRVMKAIEAGISKVDGASKFSVGRRAIYDWIELIFIANNLAPK